MKDLIAAIQFISILPVGKTVNLTPHKAAPLFPVVGILLGILVAICDITASAFWPQPVVALLDVCLLVILTGAFHLDGLGDAADGLYSQRPKDIALAIMKDSRTGTMGLVAITCCLALKWAGIYSLNEHRIFLLIIIPAYARAGMLFGIRFLEYGRPQGGTGLDFFQKPLQNTAFYPLIGLIALSFFAGWECLILNTGFFILTAIILWYYKKKIGCITGDMLGAMTEIIEAGLFLLISAGNI